jgi:hypothetical protein
LAGSSRAPASASRDNEATTAMKNERAERM